MTFRTDRLIDREKSRRPDVNLVEIGSTPVASLGQSSSVRWTSDVMQFGWLRFEKRFNLLTLL